RQNIISPNAGIAFSPIHDLTLSLQQYFFWRASDQDSIYNKSSAIIRAANGTTARYVGAETDLLATYNFTRHLQGYTGYSYFFPGGFIHKSGTSQGQQLLLCGASVYVLKNDLPGIQTHQDAKNEADTLDRNANTGFFHKRRVAI